MIRHNRFPVKTELFVPILFFVRFFLKKCKISVIRRNFPLYRVPIFHYDKRVKHFMKLCIKKDGGILK